MTEHLEHIGKILGDYRLLRWLGGGGFGHVYLAEHLRDGMHVALKELHVTLTKREDFHSFLNEARAFRLKHPHIVPLLDFGLSREDVPFLVMEYAPRGTVRDRYPKGCRIPLSTVVDMTTQVASALQYAHDHHVVHRDVKPENMLLRLDDEILLSDFGIATTSHSTNSLSANQGVGGTVPYMAPEQLEGRPRPASDQYALAVVIYEWLAGSCPFQGTAVEIAMQHVTKAPPALVDQVSGLPEEVEEVIFQALAKDPKARFASIQAFASALQQASTPTFRQPASRQPSSQESLMSNEPLTASSPPMIAPPTIAPSVIAQEAATTTPVPKEMKPFLPPTTPVKPPTTPTTSRSVPLPARKSRRITVYTTVLIALTLFLVGGGSYASMTLMTRNRELQATATMVAAPMATARAAVHAYTTEVATHGIMFGFDAQHSHNNIYERILNVATVSRLHQLWTISTADQRGVFSFTVANGVIYAGSHNGTAYAFDALTGRQKWQSFSLVGSVDSTPAVVNGMVYMGAADEKLHALDVNSGQQKWVAPTGGFVLSSPAVVNGVVYVGSDDHKLYAFDTVTGRQKWVSPSTGGRIGLSSPAVANGVVYVGSEDNTLYAFDALTGQQKWSAPMGAPPLTQPTSSSPAVADGIVYIGSANDKKLYAFDALTGQQKWSAPSGIISSSPAIANGVVYSEADNYTSDITMNSRKLYAFDALTGQQKWSVLIGNPLTGSSAESGTFSSPTVANGVIYAGSDHLYAYDAGTGQQKWVALTIRDINAASPLVANGVVYGAGAGKLYAFSL